MRTDFHHPRHLGAYVQVSMFAKKWHRDDLDLAISDFFQFRNLDHVLEAAVFQQQLDRWVLQLSVSAAWNYDVLYFVPDLQKGFKKHMVLVIVCDQQVVN